MSKATINVLKMFGGQIPKINRGNAINRVQKILKANHVTGLPSHWPKMYYGQTRANVNVTRMYRNSDVAALPDGAYLYLIEYNQKTKRYYKQFVRVLNKLESGSRHFQLPTIRPGFEIVAAGELSKQGEIVRFNLESGTYTMNLMKKTPKVKNTNNTTSQYINLVKNAFRNANLNINYTPNILVPNIPGNFREMLTRGNVSFAHGPVGTQPNPRVLAELAKLPEFANLKRAGRLTNASARNLIIQLLNKNMTPK
jgi:hypothetical protein